MLGSFSDILLGVGDESVVSGDGPVSVPVGQMLIG